MTLRTLAGALALALMTGAGRGRAQPAAKPGSPADASPAEVKRLVGQFRGTIKEPEKRTEIVREAIKAGPAAAAGIMAAIQHEFGTDVTRYTAKFSQKAVPLAQKRSGSKQEEISKLRETVLGLSKGPNFTHETIVAKADPAMRRLRRSSSSPAGRFWRQPPPWWRTGGS